MAVSEKILGMMTQSSWVRKMFEAGSSLKQVRRKNVFDFSIGS